MVINMSNNRFYWIKLKTNFFNREDIDFLLSQKNGAEYVVLYQMLCLSTANNNGRLETEMVQGKNRYGHSTNYAIYRLTKDIEEVEE